MFLAIVVSLLLNYTYIVDSYESQFVRSHFIEVEHKIFKYGDRIYNPEFPEDIFYIETGYGRGSNVYLIRRVGWHEGEEDNFEIYFHRGSMIMKYE